MAALFLTAPFGASRELFSGDMCNAEAILLEDKKTPGKKNFLHEKILIVQYFYFYGSFKLWQSNFHCHSSVFPDLYRLFVTI